MNMIIYKRRDVTYYEAAENMTIDRMQYSSCHFGCENGNTLKYQNASEPFYTEFSQNGDFSVFDS